MSRSNGVAALALGGVIVLALVGCGAGATPTPAPTPTAAPTPTPVDVGAVFLAQVIGPTSGRLPATGTISGGGTEGTITGTLESSGGDDSASTMTFEIDGSKQTSESIRVGTKKWSREDGGVWILDPRPAATTNNLMAYLKTLTALEDTGIETKGGRQLHHLVPPAGADLSPEAMGLDSSLQDAVIEVDFWAEDDGTPAVMSIKVAWNQPNGGATLPVEMAMDVDLSGFGTPATIEPPEDAWTGFTSTRFGYSMAYPAGWSVSEGDGSDVYSLEGQPYVYVTPQDITAGYTLDRLHDDLVAYYQENDIKALPDTDEEYAVDGVPARVLTYRFTNAAKTRVYLVDAITVNGATGWEIYLAQEQVNEEESRAFFDTMVSTFSFEP